MKKIMILNTLILASGLFGCNPKEILEPNLTPSFVVIDGDTIKTRDDKSKVIKQKYNFDIIDGETFVIRNYEKLKKPKADKKNDDILKKGIEDPILISKIPRIIGIGSGGSVGIGANNYAIEYSITNLIANMMGVEFINPYFDLSDYNGYGTTVPSKDNYTKGPIPKFKLASNNLAVESIDINGDVKLKKLKPGRYDNFTLLGEGAYGQGGDSPILPYYGRFDSKLKYSQLILNEKFDFLIDHGYNDEFTDKNGLTGFIPGQKNTFSYTSQPYINPRLDIYSDLIKRKGLKGILINYAVTTPYLPNLLISVKNVRNELAKYQKSNLLSLDAVTIRPTVQIDSLLSPVINMTLKPFIRNNEKILSFSTQYADENILFYDKPRISKLAQQIQMPELDVNHIFVKIYQGNYTTYDGVKISYKDLYILPNGFGGSSILHNIIIANEALKLINSFYGTNYPLYNTRDFLNK